MAIHSPNDPQDAPRRQKELAAMAIITASTRTFGPTSTVPDLDVGLAHMRRALAGAQNARLDTPEVARCLALKEKVEKLVAAKVAAKKELSEATSAPQSAASTVKDLSSAAARIQRALDAATIAAVVDTPEFALCRARKQEVEQMAKV